VDLLALLALEPHGPDTFVGTGPTYPWGGLYGGQIVAQALRAAAATAPEGALPHSCHAYFIRRGDAAEPIRFEVQRLRDGRTYSARQVVARQSAGAILGLSASFAQPEAWEVEVQVAHADPGPGPDEAAEHSWSTVFERRDRPRGVGEVAAWFRSRGDLPDDPLLGACALAYASDDLPAEAVISLHPDLPALPPGEPWEGFNGTSLDHAIWFHRPVHPGAWQLHALRCTGLLGTRGLAVGSVFTEDGQQVATVTQEVMVRRKA
jgi:acyl-CoA thioesterase-2